jgi:hypothetical protein
MLAVILFIARTEVRLRVVVTGSGAAPTESRVVLLNKYVALFFRYRYDAPVLIVGIVTAIPHLQRSAVVKCSSVDTVGALRELNAQESVTKSAQTPKLAGHVFCKIASLATKEKSHPVVSHRRALKTISAEAVHNCDGDLRGRACGLDWIGGLDWVEKCPVCSGIFEEISWEGRSQIRKAQICPAEVDFR